jgi:hypothetical protein
VASFGIEKATLRNPLITQVTVHDYENDDDFIIELETKSESDELILAKVEPSRTLAATIQSVQQRKSNSPYFALWVENDEVMEEFTHPR